MEIAVITDQHFGARNDSQVFDRHFEEFYRDVFFPTLDERGIKHVFMLGDTFDRRKYINFQTLASCKRYYFDELARRNIETHIIVGNHDAHFKNTIEVNSVDLVLGEYSNIIPYSSPRSVTLGGTEILVLPWICDDNEQDTIRIMRETRAQILFGHLEIKGFEMYRGAVMDHGADASLFSKFELVASGHFHHPSKKGNIQYLGAPYEMTWSDYDDARGFHIFDTSTRTMQFMRNPLRMFHRLSYDDTDATSVEQALARRPPSLADKTVKVVVKAKTNPSLFDQAMNSIEAERPANVQVVDDHHNQHLVEDADIASEVTDTLTVLKDYVNKHSRVDDRKALDTLLTELYHTALEVQWSE